VVKRESDSRSRKTLLIALRTLLRDCLVLLGEDGPYVAEAIQLVLGAIQLVLGALIPK
jgi:hypothetical protein